MECYGLFLAKNIPYRLYICSIIFVSVACSVTVNTKENVGVMLHRPAITSYFKPCASVSICVFICIHFSTPLGKKTCATFGFYYKLIQCKVAEPVERTFFPQIQFGLLLPQR